MKKFLSIILALVFCISSLSIYAYAVPRTTYDSYEVAQAKIDDALKEKLETMEDDEYVKVVVWLKDYGDEPLYALLSERYGEEITADNEDFIKEIPAAPHIQIRGSSNKGELFQMAKINSFKNE